MDNRPRAVFGRFAAWLQKAPLTRAFLWGALAAAALPPLHLLPVLLFSVPAFLRLIAEARSIRSVFARAWLYGFGLGLAGLYWLTEPILKEAQDFWWLVPFAAPAMAAAVAVYAIPPALAVWKLPEGLGRILVFAAAWTFSNIAQQFFFTGFPWNFWGTDWAIPGTLGNIFLQPAAIVSVHGLTLLTVLLAGLPTLRRAGPPALLAALALWAGFGWLRLQTPVPQTDVTLALVQPGFPVTDGFDRATLDAHWQRLLAMSAAGLKTGADAIIWPEDASPWLLDSDAGARDQLAAVTGTTPVLAGSLRNPGPGDYRNSLVVTAGPLPALTFYDKWKLVPFGEYMPKWLPLMLLPQQYQTGFTPGIGPKTLTVPGLPPFAPLICYEDVFPGEMIDESHRPAWIAVITDDTWFGDTAGPRQHLADARLRAVEEGLPLARDANSGISAIFDPLGRVTARLGLNATGVLAAPLPGTLPPTPFARYGLIIPIFLAALCGAIGTILAVTRRGQNFTPKLNLSI